MQCHRSVHSVDPLVVPGMPLVSQIVGHLATAPTRLPVGQLLQLLCDGLICTSLCLVAIRTTTHLHRATSLSFAQFKFLDCVPSQFPSFLYFESFFRRE